MRAEGGGRGRSAGDRRAGAGRGVGPAGSGGRGGGRGAGLGVYFGGSDPAADKAVARLVAAFRAGARGGTGAAADAGGGGESHRNTDAGGGGESGGGGDSGGEGRDGETLANRVSILVQAYEATGSLVERARGAAAEYGVDGAETADGVNGLLYETLRHDPPVLAMRRTALRPTSVAGVEIVAGDLVTLDIAAANRDPEVFDRPDEFDAGRGETLSLTYGSAPRRCPGVGHSLALAAGILEVGGR